MRLVIQLTGTHDSEQDATTDNTMCLLALKENSQGEMQA